MTIQTEGVEVTTLRGAMVEVPERGRASKSTAVAVLDFGSIEPLGVRAVAECAEGVIEDLHGPLAVAPAVFEPLGQAACDAATIAPPAVAATEERVLSVDEYAKAVLYNGLGHYQAARAAAERGVPSATTSRCSKAH